MMIKYNEKTIIQNAMCDSHQVSVYIIVRFIIIGSQQMINIARRQRRGFNRSSALPSPITSVYSPTLLSVSLSPFCGRDDGWMSRRERARERQGKASRREREREGGSSKRERREEAQSDVMQEQRPSGAENLQ